MILYSNKTMLSVNMYKTCNLFTVKNTSSEARRDTSCVDYYYIDFCNDMAGCNEIVSTSLSRVVNVIYDYLDERDIYFVDFLYICKKMLDGSTKRVFKVSIDSSDRHMRIARVK